MVGEFFCGVISVPHSPKGKDTGMACRAPLLKCHHLFPKDSVLCPFFVVDFIFPVYKLLREAGGYQLSEDPSEFRVPLIKDRRKLCLNHGSL